MLFDIVLKILNAIYEVSCGETNVLTVRKNKIKKKINIFNQITFFLTIMKIKSKLKTQLPSY